MKHYIRKLNIGITEVYEIRFSETMAWINVKDGFNLCRLNYRDHELIRFQQERFVNGSMYGTPILFPTPNRTKHNRFMFEGKEYSALMHGFIKKQQFNITSLEVNDENAEILAYVETNAKILEQFPFRFRLDLRFTIESHQITYQYTVYNLDDFNMPYGFALHPFFSLEPKKTSITVKSNSVMERMEDKIPTGELTPVQGTLYDLNKPRLVSELDLDDVYTQLHGIPQVHIDTEYLSLNVEVSDVFSHLVVYTPPGADFFCVEPQTCATDAINLYTAGHIKNSGLRIVRPGELDSGKVRFRLI